MQSPSPFIGDRSASPDNSATTNVSNAPQGGSNNDEVISSLQRTLLMMQKQNEDLQAAQQAQLDAMAATLSKFVAQIAPEVPSATQSPPGVAQNLAQKFMTPMAPTLVDKEKGEDSPRTPVAPTARETPAMTIQRPYVASVSGKDMSTVGLANLAKQHEGKRDARSKPLMPKDVAAATREGLSFPKVASSSKPPTLLKVFRMLGNWAHLIYDYSLTAGPVVALMSEVWEDQMQTDALLRATIKARDLEKICSHLAAEYCSQQAVATHMRAMSAMHQKDSEPLLAYFSRVEEAFKAVEGFEDPSHWARHAFST